MDHRAIVMRRCGGPEVLVEERRETPVLRAGEVRIRMLAAAVNHSDLEIRAGNWPILREPKFPYVPGLEVVGEVIACGDGVTDLRVGERVTTMMQGLGGVRAERDGGYAEVVSAAAASCARIGSDLDPQVVAAIGLAGVTAHQGLSRAGRVSAATRVCITGAGGGVGSVAVALSAGRGADVIAVASRPTQVDYLKSLGARRVIVARTAAELEAQLEPNAADVVLDAVAGPLFAPLVRALAPYGGYCLVGAIAGGDVAFDAWQLLGGARLTGYSSEDLDGASLCAAMSELQEQLRNGRLAPPEMTVVPLAEAARAHAQLEQKKVSGRVVLVP